MSIISHIKLKILSLGFFSPLLSLKYIFLDKLLIGIPEG